MNILEVGSLEAFWVTCNRGQMFLMYVDESSDPGVNLSASRFFLLSGMVVHETAWETTLDRLVQFRRRMKGVYGLRQRDEIHAAPFIHSPLHKMNGILRGHRLGILRAYLKELAQARNIRFLHVPRGCRAIHENAAPKRTFPPSKVILRERDLLPCVRKAPLPPRMGNECGEGPKRVKSPARGLPGHFCVKHRQASSC